MAYRLISDESRSAIGDAIRSKVSGEAKHYAFKPSQMPQYILSIGGDPKIEQLTVTANGTFVPEGIDGFSPVIVNVPTTEVIEPVIEELTITANGTYTVPEGVHGYNNITVYVQSENVEELPRSEEGLF